MNNLYYNDRTPFYFIATIFLLITIILSLVATFSTQNNSSDFFPMGGYYNNTFVNDNTIIDKLCWYLSQLTHHTLLLLFFYFFMALLKKRSVKFFKIIAPLALTISVLYFFILFPKQKLKLHQLPFTNFSSHFMIIVLVIGEYLYIPTYSFQETTNCLVFIITALLSIYINYFLRGVWSYDMIKLDEIKGWKLVTMSTIVMYFFSILFFIFKSKETIFSMNINNYGYFISSMINLIFTYCFISINN